MHVCVYIYTYIILHVCVYIYIYICMYICIYIHTYIWGALRRRCSARLGAPRRFGRAAPTAYEERYMYIIYAYTYVYIYIYTYIHVTH